eukprot:CAMPEP_0202701016 /NCGR_PEP_ID=MMETSP1385-20130828/14125_1 /ASSEMBLY_ACC=CAM_ASM_000861 /TAXON_ID=933848 /ORGANISM="Elphidium margaritaceum" /LENGTH=136 /DNA_ID=CAMNT_0049358321 /DNA_START=186 /DNA_END=596 /DNA_ORIENTATION=-
MNKISAKKDVLFELFRQFLLCSGFAVNADGIYYELSTENVVVCNAVGDMLTERVNEEQAELDKKRERIKQESMQRQRAFVNKDKQKKELLKKQINSVKKEKSVAPKQFKASKAKPLNFGRKDVKVDFKTSGGGGGG